MSYPVIFPELLPDGAPESVESMLERGRALGLRGLEPLAEAFKAAEVRRDRDAWIYREEARLRLTYAELLRELEAAKAAGDKAGAAELRKTVRTLRRSEGDAVAGRLSGRSLELAVSLREGRPKSLRPTYPKRATCRMERAKCEAMKPKRLTLPL